MDKASGEKEKSKTNSKNNENLYTTAAIAAAMDAYIPSVYKHKYTYTDIMTQTS